MRDKASSDLKHPGGYMFKELPEVDASVSYPDFLIAEMDKYNIEFGLVPVSFAEGDIGRAAVLAHPGRLFGSMLIDPNRGVDAIRDLKRGVREADVRAAATFPSGLSPQVAINDKKMYPSMPRASSSTFRSSSTPACPDRGFRCTRRRSSTSTKSCTTSPS